MNTSFLAALQNEVSHIAKTFSIREDQAFALWFAKLELNLDDDDAFEALRVEGPNDKGMDLFWIDHPNQRVFIAQCKYSPRGEYRPKLVHLASLLSCTDWLASPEALQQEGRPELVAAAKEYLDAIGQDYLVELWFVHCAQQSKGIDTRVRLFNANPQHEQPRRKAVQCSLDLLQTFYEEARGKDRRIETARIKTNTQAFEVAGAFGQALVTSIRGSELVSLYEQFGDRLFARQVRLFLHPRRGSVNAVMIETIRDSQQHGNFWAYNNGLTIVCDSYTFDRKTGVLELSNFSIVNGCQTTVALARTRDSVTDNISVLTRVVRPPETILDSIILFTNSQNPIRRWDLASQDRIQRRLQDEFKMLKRPVYYALRRGEWDSLGPKIRKTFGINGKSSARVIKYDLLAQYLAAFKGNAVVAYKNKAFLFDRYYKETFPADLQVQEALFVWRAGELTRELVREEIRKEQENVNKGQKEREKYVLMLKRGGRFYALGVVGLLTVWRNGPDHLQAITEDQIVSRNATDKIKKYASMAIQLYKQAVDFLLQSSATDLSVLIREEKFFREVADKVKNFYATMAVNEKWLAGALPKLS